MQDFDRLNRIAKRLQERYPRGTRIVLLRQYHAIPIVQLRRIFYVSRTKNLKAVAELPARIFVKDYGKVASKCANRGLRGVAFSLGNDPNPILPGTRGTVNVVDDIATVHCTFDNGRTLGIAYGEDSFRALTAEELAEESECEDQEQVGGMHL